MINFIGEKQFDNLEKVEELIKLKTEEYKEYLGWTNEYNSTAQLDNIIKYSEEIKNKYEYVIISGAGGSYLGARAIIEAINCEYEKKKTNVIFIGHNFSSTELCDILKVIENKEVCLIAISKSGSTLETSIGYQVIRDWLKNKYENINDRIFIVTNDESGYLLDQAKINGYRMLKVPNDVGGRYSLHTVVGLFPMAVAGIDIERFLQGISDYKLRISKNYYDNPSIQYALMRNEYFVHGKNKEFLVTYNNKLEYLQKWYVQLFGESEGKKKEVIFPSYSINSTDLHSIGQYIQEGPGDLFETVISVSNYPSDFQINLEEFNSKFVGLNGYSLNRINTAVMEATKCAHLKNDVSTSKIVIDKIDEYNLGELCYFFMYACFVSSILFDVHPFNQPGVEQYKRIFSSLL